MSLFFYIQIALIFMWLAIALFDYGELCYVWQLKGFRFDRFRDYVSTKQGKTFLKSFLVGGRLLLLVIIAVLIFFRIDFLSLLFSVVILFEILQYLIKFLCKKIRRPAVTKRAVAIILAAILVELIFWMFFDGIIGILLIFCLRFLVISLLVGASFLPTWIIKKFYIAMAARKIRKYGDLKIIGVTGSYGKTTVKEFLLQILSVKYQVVATPKNINTEIGIARFILKNDFSKMDIFVVEMGAYGLGEIKLICDMVSPQIGVLTSINEQHLSLFGSIENTQHAKYELLFSLPSDGLAIVNSDNDYCREFLSEIKSEVETFGQHLEFNPDCLIDSVKIKENGEIVFDFVVDGKKQFADASVIGRHNAMNIAPCILVAKHFGLEMQEIIAQISKLALPDGTLQKYQYGQSLILDDSYNSNPDGFIAALKVLNGYNDEWKKIVITRGMLELGEKSNELHEKIGKQISKHSDELVVISSDNEESFKKGAGEKMNIRLIFQQDELLQFLKKKRDTKSVILLENRMPPNVINELKRV